MSARVWTHITLAAACLACGTSSMAQTPQQVRPAPVSGHIGEPAAAADPAAVALRPASHAATHQPAQPATSTAVQVPPPANPHEPLLLPAPAGSSGAAQGQQAPKDAAAVPHRQHLDHTQGVAKPRKSSPQKQAQKTPRKARPHAAGKAGGAHEGNNKDGAGKKKGAAAPLATSKVAHNKTPAAKHGMKPHPKTAPVAGAKASAKTGAVPLSAQKLRTQRHLVTKTSASAAKTVPVPHKAQAKLAAHTSSPARAAHSARKKPVAHPAAAAHPGA